MAIVLFLIMHGLCCLNESTGELLWQYSASDSIQYSPLASNGRVFLSAGCSVYCLNAVDGSFIWNFTTDPEESKMTHEDFNEMNISP